MAIRFSAQTDVVTSSSGLPGATYTVAGWFYVSVNRANWSKIWDVEATGGRWQYLGLDPPADVPSIIFALNGAGHVNVRAAVVGSWFFAAIVADGVGYTLYSGTPGSALTTSTWNVTPIAPTFLAVGGGGTFAHEWFNGRVGALKVWGAALTQSQVEAERTQYQPALTTDLLHNHPFTEAELVDYAGGNHLAAGSTAATIEDGPPIPWSGARPRLILPAVEPATGPTGTVGLGLTTTALGRKVAISGGVCGLAGASPGRASKSAPATGASSIALTGAATAQRVALSAGVCSVVVGSVFSRQQLSAQSGSSALGLSTSATSQKIAITGGVSTLSGGSAGGHYKAAYTAGTAAPMLGALAQQQKLGYGGGLAGLLAVPSGVGRKAGRLSGQTVLGLTSLHLAPSTWVWPLRVGSVTVESVVRVGSVYVE